MIFKGVDVSSNNAGGTGIINWQAVKAAGYSFAMVRVGYGSRTGGWHGYISKSFAPQLEGAQAAGLEVGAYWYSYAATPDEAEVEARACLEAVKPYKLSYPLALDFEHPPVIGGMDADGKRYPGLSKDQQLDIIDAFMGPLEASRYYAMLYMSASPLAALRKYAMARVDRYACWVAQYASKCTYPGAYGIWQHHGNDPGYTGRIPGVQGAIDLNDCYEDYPTIIKRKGLNGWGTPTAPEKPQETPDYRAMYEAEREARKAAEAQGAALADRLEAIAKIVGG